jgi:hypothetical protein
MEQVAMSPELTILDDLLCGELSFPIARMIFRDEDRMRHSISEMLREGEIVFIDNEGVELPAWKCRQALNDPEMIHDVRIRITAQGVSRVG